MQEIAHQPSFFQLILTLLILVYGLAYLLRRDAGIRLVNKTIVRLFRNTLGGALEWIGKKIRGH